MTQSVDWGLRGQGGSKPVLCRTNTEQREAALTGTELQRLNNNGNTKPKVEETFNVITNRLKERRRELGLPDSIKVSAAAVFAPHTSEYCNVGLVVFTREMERESETVDHR